MMIFRAALTVALALGVLAAPFAAEGQQTGKVPRIGVLWPGSENPELAAFRQGLRELGYIEGQNILVEYRFARGKDDALPDLARNLVRLQVDVIVTWAVVGARAAKQATATIPIVNGSMGDPVAAKLVASLSRPGGNLTGLTSRSPELSAKRLELIREAVPRLSRVAVLSTANATAQLGLQETETAARSLGLHLQAVEVRGRADFDNAFAQMERERAGALIVLADLLFLHHVKTLVDLTAKHRLPAIHWNTEFTNAGGLMSYSPNSPDMFRRAAVYVDKILKGAQPSDLPIEGPTKFELVINRASRES